MIKPTREQYLRAMAETYKPTAAAIADKLIIGANGMFSVRFSLENEAERIMQKAIEKAKNNC